MVFLSTATDLVAGDTNGFLDIFVRDLVAGDTARVSVPGGGGEANGHNYHPAISGSGNLVFFDSLATNLLPSDANGTSDDVLAVANPFFVAVHRPDNVLSRAGDAGGVGNGVYNATAAGQTLTAVSRRARPVRANLFVGNDGNVEDSCLVRGARGNRYFGTSYFSGGNRSAQVLAGTYRTPVLAAGESEVLNVVVSPKRKALLRKVRRKGRTVLVWRRVQGRFVLVSRSAAAPALSDAAALVARHR